LSLIGLKDQPFDMSVSHNIPKANRVIAVAHTRLTPWYDWVAGWLAGWLARCDHHQDYETAARVGLPIVVDDPHKCTTSATPTTESASALGYLKVVDRHGEA
jgi:hypothetical protein